MMRFCTSRSLNTSTTSTRFSDSATNSIWVMEACRVRGSVTTPASWVALDSSCDTVAIRSVGWSRLASTRSEEHTSELQSRSDLVCRLLLEKKKKKTQNTTAL